MPANTVSVTRPGKWRNPFTVAEYGRASAIEKYRKTLAARDLSELRGKNLACYCPLDQPCHADARAGKQVSHRQPGPRRRKRRAVTLPVTPITSTHHWQ
jgi:hypothetical protein